MYSLYIGDGAGAIARTVSPRVRVLLYSLIGVIASKGLVRPSSGRAVDLGVFLQLNLPRTAAKSNTVISRTLSTKVSSQSIQRIRVVFLYCILGREEIDA
jgi:hypothetical protein